MRILVVEDEQDLLESLVEGLRLNSYAVDGCDDGCKAHELVSVVEYDLVVLDLNLPGMDGFQLLREIRTVNAEVKVLILSARDGLEDKVRGLDAGANDYLTKPFHFAELEARVRGLLRRRFTQQDRLLTFRGVMLDTAAHAVEAAGQPLTLTRKEYALLEYLLLHRGKVVSAEEFMEHVWDGGVDSLSNALRVHMASLRKKLRAALGCDLILPTGEKGPLYAEDRGLGAKFKYRIESIVYVICTIAVAGVATYMITENCLSPLVNLKNQVANLSAQNLSDSPEGGAPQTGDEIESLSNAFQGMRLRLDSAFETQKRFAANAAHELRTPLAAIQTRLDVFSKHEDHTEEEYQALIGSLRRQTERLSLLVKDLLDMSCMEEVPMQDAIDVAPLMDEIAHELEPLAEKKGMSFRTEGGGTVLGSDRLIARALYNLAENAVKYGADGGHVVLAASFQERNVLIRVEDDGPGIPEEHREKIFEPFYRVDKSRSRAMGGAGLGLPMTRAILERHGGTIWLEERPGGGCCFCAALPTGKWDGCPGSAGEPRTKGVV